MTTITVDSRLKAGRALVDIPNRMVADLRLTTPMNGVQAALFPTPTGTRVSGFRRSTVIATTLWMTGTATACKLRRADTNGSA